MAPRFYPSECVSFFFCSFSHASLPSYFIALLFSSIAAPSIRPPHSHPRLSPSLRRILPPPIHAKGFPSAHDATLYWLASGRNMPFFSCFLIDSTTEKESFQSCKHDGRIVHRPALCLALCMAAFLSYCHQSLGFRPLKERAFLTEDAPWLDQHYFPDENDGSLGPYPLWNISGTYKGKWWMYDSQNTSVKPLNFDEDRGNAIVELLSLPTKVYGVHYVQGEVLLRDGLYFDSSDFQMTRMKMEGVYVWPFRQLRMILSSPFDGDITQSEDFVNSNPYHLLGIFSSQVLQESPMESTQNKGKKAFVFEMAKKCKIQLTSDMSLGYSEYKNRIHEHEAYRMQGILESPMVNGDGECFSTLVLNATSVNVDAYYSKAVNYTLMVTFISFLQVLIFIKQMEHSNTQSGAAKVSLLMIGQQAIVDAYLCLLHLTAGILVESLFNAFATAAFFKFVIFSIFEMRYLLAIWKARRPLNSGEGWETMRRELSVLYSRFYGVLLGGILIMYEFHSMLRYILFLFYSFWIPQIVMNVIHDIRKPLHPFYIFWMTITRLAIPLYAFGCPGNFLRLDTDFSWCISIASFLTIQGGVLLLQHYFGARWFIPQQFLPVKYCYFRRVDHGENHNVDCVICMAAVEIRQRTSEFMVTPCEHFFHAGCLQRWMDIKMECPTCRRPLPPL